MKPALSIADTIALLRQRYHESLVCIECSRLIAIKRASYAKSNLAEVARLAYVCAECRMAVAESARATARFAAFRPRVQLRPSLAVFARGYARPQRLGESAAAYSARVAEFEEDRAASLGLLQKADLAAAGTPPGPEYPIGSLRAGSDGEQRALSGPPRRSRLTGRPLGRPKPRHVAEASRAALRQWNAGRKGKMSAEVLLLG